MSQIHDGPLATYSSLTDRNLAGYFANTRMRRHLRKAGLIDKRGQIISENQYRLNMARKEHKKHVKDLLAQAIVHKTLDIERNRQVEIKRKLEEIAKLELVRRVRAQKYRKGDEDILPYLSPRSSRPSSRYRPRSAPSDRQYHDSYEADVIYVDDEGRPVTPPKDLEDDHHKKEEIDTRHLYALDSAALKKYALTLSKIEQGEGMGSPYLISQVPTPPRSARGPSRNSYRDGKYKRLQRPRTANSLSPYRSQRTGAVQGTLMLHRQEPAMMHQGEVQTLCEVTMKYFGPNLILPRDQRDPTQEVEIEQQHCGGNTLPVFKERIKPGDEFTFISRRHRGYPFSLSIFVEGRISARVSTCCEYGHAKGVRLGGKMGQFCIKTITGATPCYKCKLNAQASPRSLRRPPIKTKQKAEEIKEEIIVLRPEKKGEKEKDEEDKYDDDFEEDSDSRKDSGTEKYKDDFEEEPVKRRSRSSSSSSEEERARRRSRSKSSSSSSSSSRSRSRTPTPRKEQEDNRKIYGLLADEDVQKAAGSDDEKSDKPTTPLKIEGMSDEDEQPESKKWTQRQEPDKNRRDSSSSSSSSSTTKSRESPRESPRQEKKAEIKTQQPVEVSYERSSESTRSDTLVSEDSEQKEKQKVRRSSSSSSSSSDSDVKRYTRQLSEEERRKEEQRRRIEERREEERKREEEAKRKLEAKLEEERIRMEREEVERQRREEQRQKEEEERKRRETYAKRKAQPQIDSTPQMDNIPPAPTYSRIYEDSRQEALAEVEVDRSIAPKAPQKELILERNPEYVRKATRRSSSSSTSSGSEADEPKKVVTPPKAPSPYRKSSSSSSSSESETDTSKDKEASKVTPPRTPSPAKVTPPRSRTTSGSSSSSSSDSETETDADKKVVRASPVPSPKRRSSTSSTSDTETTTDTDQKPARPVTPVRAEPKVIKEEKESSSSSSSSDSETETDTDKKPRKVTPPPQPLVPVVETKKETETSSSSDSETETETATETETDNEKVKKEMNQQTEKLAPIVEKKKSSSSSGSGSESDKQKKPKEVKKETTTTTSDSSGSSDSSSDSSDSEDDEEKRKAAAKTEDVKEEIEEKTAAPPGDEEKITSDDPFISESEGEQKKVTIFASESDGDNMHGGNDPDNLASSNPEVKSYLTKIGVAPGQPVEGSVLPLIEGKKDVELSNMALTSKQISEIEEFLSKGDNIQSVCLRNAGIDDDMFEPIADALKSTNSKPMMLNFNLNKLKSGSVEKLVEILVDKPSIDILLLHGNPLGDEGVKVLVNGILDIQKAFSQREAEEVDGATDDKGKTTHYTVLKELDLGDTDIGDEGMGHIAYLLENVTDLKTLNLNGNINVTYTGWKRLSKAMKKNKTLRTLSLDFNKIGDEAMAALVSGLKINTSLQTLDLESTGLTESGGIQLIDLVKCNTTILDITILPGNKISEKTQEEIRNYLGLNKEASPKVTSAQ